MKVLHLRLREENTDENCTKCDYYMSACMPWGVIQKEIACDIAPFCPVTHRMDKEIILHQPGDEPIKVVRIDDMIFTPGMRVLCVLQNGDVRWAKLEWLKW